MSENEALIKAAIQVGRLQMAKEIMEVIRKHLEKETVPLVEQIL